ncbi:MAG TPA: hypothetical protein DD638_03360, partial [Pasteurellaceae bacterium]|nr:hypothetical protein [Pasteurellaceae bacterium]
EEKLRAHKEIYPSDNLVVENFLFTKSGLMFSYPSGKLDDSEKAPVELLVDWSSLKDILKPEYFWQ